MPSEADPELPEGVTSDGRGSVEIGPGVAFGTGVRLEGEIRIGPGCRIGRGVTLRGVHLGAGCAIEDGATLGYVNSTGRFRDAGSAPGLAPVGGLVRVGEGTLIRNQATVYHDVQIGAGCWLNHGAIVRERSTIGAGTSIGSYTVVEGDVAIGARCVLHNHVMVAGETRIEDCVFVGPNVTFTNNSPIGHLRDLSDEIRAPVLRFGCALGGGVCLNPGVVVGAETVVASGATVTSDTGDAVIVAGVPARKLKEIPSSWRILAEVRREFAGAPPLPEDG